ncbi:P3 protein [Callorhinchus milii]|uniref:P3 protein n=1 Tax=Callorhinchus milii TaxID=7868 RepID=UPI001C3F515F|nr:P3 protein [Callorhinchus milii]
MSDLLQWFGKANNMQKVLMFWGLISGVCCVLDSSTSSSSSSSSLSNNNHSRSSSSTDLTRYYVHIGDGSSEEFDFPENTKGIIVISSGYGIGWEEAEKEEKEEKKEEEEEKREKGSHCKLTVESMDPDVLRVLNISNAQTVGFEKSYIVSIQSGMAGSAALLIRLLDGTSAEPTVVAERSDYTIKVSPNDEAVGYAALAHFSRNPVLYALLPLIFINKCAFGCKVEISVLRGLLKQPHPVILGMIGQFVLMPLYGYALSQMFSLPKALSLGLIITCSTPGGGGGYLYSLLLGGDVTLAISMTLLSTVVATGMMPLSSSLYSHVLNVHETLYVPFSKILITLLFIAIPISTGMFIKYKFPKLSKILLLLIRPLSFILIVGGLFMAYQMGADILSNVRNEIILAGIAVPVFGLFIGYLMAYCLSLPVPLCKTVSIEIGVQNSLLALAVLQLSFRRFEADFASQAPFIVALSSTSEMLIVVVVYLVYKKLRPSPDSENGDFKP